jgi:hypothetical protein
MSDSNPGTGATRLQADLFSLGYEAVEVVSAGGQEFVIIPGYEIAVGQFASRVIDLGVHVPPDYPQNTGSSVHVKALPQLFARGNVQGVRNIQTSLLGTEWDYWSHRFTWKSDRTTKNLMSQINSIFNRA